MSKSQKGTMNTLDDDSAAKGTNPEAYVQLMRRVREAHQTEPDLDAQSWRRIRQSIPDSGPARWRTHWALVGLTSIVGIILVILLHPPERELNESSSAHRVGTATSAQPPDPGKVEEAMSLVSGAVNRTEAMPGQKLIARERSQLRAHGRHALGLDADTALTVNAWTPTHMSLTLERGRVHCEVNRQSAEEIFELHTPEGQLRVLGTTFSVSRHAQEGTRIEVSHGEVALVTHTGQRITLRAGEQRHLAPIGGQRQAPEVLPAPPTLGQQADVGQAVAPVSNSHKGQRTASNPQRRPKPPTRRRTKERRSAKAANPDVGVAGADPSPVERVEAIPPTLGTVHSNKTIVEIVVPDETMSPPKVTKGNDQSTRDTLIQSVRLIRRGACNQAIRVLKGLARKQREHAQTIPPDLYFLMGYCKGRQGDSAAAAAFMDRYRRAGGGRFKVADDGSPALPSVDQVK